MTTLERSGSPSMTPSPTVSRPWWFHVLNVVLTPVVFFLVLALLAGGGQIGAEQLFGNQPWVPRFLTITIGILFSLAMCGVVWLACRFWAKIPFRSVGLVWTKRSLVAIGAGLLIAFVAELAGTLLAGSLGWTTTVTAADMRAQYTLLMVLSGIAAAVFVRGFPEELLFRGYLMNSTLKHRPALAVLVSVTIFGAIHLISSGGQQNLGEHFLYLLSPFSFAFAGATSALWLRSLWAAVAVHAGMHLATKFFVPLLAGQVPDSVAGRVLDSIGYVIAGIVCWVLYRRSGRREVLFDR